VQLYSTLSRSLVELEPPPRKIGIYVCGPTVYQRAHIGNARPFIIFAWLSRYLELRGYSTHFVHNITDVNDKIYQAAPTDSAARALEATNWYLKDIAAFGLGMPDEMPRVTGSIPEIISLTSRLIEKGSAYQAGGDVYFRVSGHASYGELSGQRPDHMRDGEDNPLKEDPRDFALWKATREGEDTSWDSPWGKGRPGWHIECSAMAEKSLGSSFEIHGGGIDLAFPHHENELAQSRAAGSEFARIWMHNGMLQFGGEKMAKSEGNIITIKEALEQYGREALLIFFMGGHYSKPIEFSDKTLAQAASQVESFKNALLPFDGQGEANLTDFYAALDDDFNTPLALSILHDYRQKGELASLFAGLELFGLASLARKEEIPKEVEELAASRVEARKEKNYSLSDSLREEIAKRGFEMRDYSEEPFYILAPLSPSAE
jgi:cysteinyl-tRNA synthetase